MTKTALLLGASGLVGGHCLNDLLKDDYYSQVEVIVRRPLNINHPKLIQHKMDFDQLEANIESLQADDVFCCLGTTIKKAGTKEAFHKVDYGYPVEIARLCLEQRAKQFLLVSALGANPGSSIFYNRVKGEVEQAIADLGFQSFTIFRPSLLLGKRDETRILEELGQKAFALFSAVMIGPVRKYRAVEGKAVAFAMVQVAKEKHQGKRIIESKEIQKIYEKHQN